jgi:hypothetical protein
MKKKKPIDYRLQMAFQLYDSADPPLSVRACEKLAGLKHPALLNALRRRELRHSMACPQCKLAPGQRPHVSGQKTYLQAVGLDRATVDKGTP